MSITKIGTDQALFNLNYTPNTTPARKFGTSKSIGSPKEGASEWAQVNQSSSAFDNLQAINSILNSVAMSIRIADTAMEKIKTYIDQMKEQLGRIIKNYPPFPPGSEERVRFLRSFNTLRQQIDQLNISPDDEGALRIVTDPSTVSAVGNWRVTAGENRPGGMIHSQEVNTGPTGLNIPELPENATDEQIYVALRNLEEVRKALNQRQSGLTADTLSLQHFLESNAKFKECSASDGKGFELADRTEAIAETKSSEYKQTLMTESLPSLTKDPSQLLELL